MKNLLILTVIIFSTTFAQAYFSTFDTADSVGKDQYKAGVEGQIISSNYKGGNVIGHFDLGINDEDSLRFELGSGIINFQIGGYYKWAPVPDTSNQPAIAALFGITYGSQNSQGVTSLRFHPIISKKFSDFTPYVSLPLGLTFGSGSTTIPFQLVLGTQWNPTFMGKFSLMAEFGAEISNAFSYFSVGTSYPF